MPEPILLGEMLVLVRTVAPPAAGGRFVVPLDAPPPLSSYLSAPLAAANLALVVIPAALFWLLRQELPERVPLHWDAAGRVNRWGSPGELWMFWGILLFDYALLWVIAWSASRERWVLSPKEPERYAWLQHRRRSLMVRMVETMIAGLNLSMAVMWLGIAYGSMPGNGEVLGAIIVFSVVLMAVAIVGPLVAFLLPMVRIQGEIKRLAGSDVLGTRPDGWRWRGMIYYAPEDPALFVPKRWGIGQTLNFARPGAWVFLGVLTLLPLVLAAATALFSR